MIQDPIPFAGPKTVDVHFMTSSEPLFLIYGNEIIALLKAFGCPLWAITRDYGGGMNYKDSAIGSISKEDFVDYVRTEYPEHFEWLLFHPEWL